MATLLSLAVALACAGRSERTLERGWRFMKGDQPGAEAPTFDDRGWAPIRLPHTWNVEDGADGGSQYRGAGWYRLKLDLSPELLKKRLFLRFGAATLVAKVYLNGREVGEHRGGFAAFTLPISKFARPGVNELSVRVDNARNTDVIPLSGDFTIYGGLTREVKLLALDEIGVSPVDEGGPGVYVTPHVVNGDGEVEVRSVLLGEVEQPANVTVETRIENAKGALVARSLAPAVVASGASIQSASKLRVPRPHLWDAIRDPYLYRARVRVIRGGRVLDEVVQPLGFRTFRIDPEKGLFLNGKPYDFRGVNLHQGRPSVGWAATRAMQEEDYRLVREMGCTGVRMAHYQHADYEVELCDRLGLVVWAELAAVNQVSDTPAFRDNAAQQLRELIKQSANHPSVLMWSLYNEPWIDKVKGDGEWRVMEDLVRLAKSMDPDRLVTGAMNWGPNYWLTWIGDIASLNHYWGWYDGAATDWPARIEAIRKEAGGRTFGISEYGAGASVIQHEVPPRPVVPASRWHPEEYQSQFHETVWPALEARPWLWCKLIWVMFDFPADWRNEGDRPGINDKGLVTADRKTKKDVFYYYQALWTKTSVLHIASRRFDPRPPGQTEIRVYSNLPAVRLRLDGRDLGEMAKVAPGVFVKTDVTLTEGRHTVVASGGRSSESVTWTVRPIAR